ncbi:MAG: MFS transporter [Anaerolineae bacterium]|nr:MFS transporter [Anaerolineae bacterium]
MTSERKTASPNPWLVLGLICLPVFIGSLDLTIVSAFLPEIVLDLQLPLQTALDDAAWMVSGYLLAYAVSMTFMGRVSDLVGRRWVYIACLIVFIIGSIMVATAHQWPSDFLYSIFRRLGQRPEREMVTLLAIIIGRIVQALGAGALVPVSLALVGDLFPPERRAQPLGVIGAVDTLGWVLGHLYGGVLVQFLPWQDLFWINVPVTAVILVVTVWALRNVPMHKTPGRFDLIGTLLITLALVGLIVGLGANVEVSSSTSGFEDLSTLPAYALPVLSAALICFLGFILVESRVKDPLIDLKLFRNRNLSAASVINLLVGFCLMIGLVSVPILVNVRAEDSEQLTEAALQVGILLSALTVPMALASVPGGWLSDRIGYQKTTLIGLGLAIIGFGLIWQTWTLEISDGLIAVEMALVGVGLGLTFSPISAAVINAASDEQRGVASALVIILRLIGMTVAVSALTTLSLNRITALAGAELGAQISDPDLYVEVYVRMTVRVLGELGLLGAVVCGAALIPAALGLRQTRTGAAAVVSGEMSTLTPGK